MVSEDQQIRVHRHDLLGGFVHSTGSASFCMDAFAFPTRSTAIRNTATPAGRSGTRRLGGDMGQHLNGFGDVLPGGVFLFAVGQAADGWGEDQRRSRHLS
jgi:hypothetical protein